jgi:hypothetical protein
MLSYSFPSTSRITNESGGNFPESTVNPKQIENERKERQQNFSTPISPPTLKRGQIRFRLANIVKRGVINLTCKITMFSRQGSRKKGGENFLYYRERSRGKLNEERKKAFTYYTLNDAKFL